MSKPFVCTGCRVRLAIRPRRPAGQDTGFQHRDFTRSAAHNQTNSHAQQLEYIQDRREEARRRRIYEEGLGQVGHGRGQHAAEGRYSGQPLRPQHLLQELDEIPRPAYRAQKGDYKKTKPWRTSHAEKAFERESHMCAPVIAQFQDQVGRSEFEGAWRTLRHLRALSLDNAKPHISQDMVKKLHQFMRRLVVNYVRSCGESDRHDPDSELPTPWNFVQVVKDIGYTSFALRPEMLWRLANGLEKKLHHDEMGQAAQNAAFQQLVLLWHEALQSKLQPRPLSQNNTSATQLLNWSFLPTPALLAEEWKGSRMRLEDVLALLVPTGTTDGGAESVADYQSAIFVTLDLLNANMTEPTEPKGSLAASVQQRPLVLFFKDILGRVAKPTVPPSIQVKLEQSEDPALGYYEALVRRFDLANLPPIRTDRRLARDNRRRSRLNELGQPIRKHASAVPLKSDIQTADPEASAEAKEITGATDSLDKSSLLEAGFSVSEDFDMEADVHRRVDTWVKRLGRSVEKDDLSQTQTLWNEAQQYSAAQAGAATLPLFLYEHFMLAFLALRQPQLALDTWAAVIQAGLQPTVKTWTVMMRGCSRANDADTLEAFWRRMRDQGVQPDRHAWSVRLYGLAKARRVDKTFAGLHDMGQEWIAAVRKQQKGSLPRTAGKQRAHAKLPEIDLAQWSQDVSGVARPDLIVVNSVVSALAKTGDEHIPKVLVWARDFAIDFDLTTYNALLNVAMRNSKTVEAFSILKHMQSRSIDPNSTTITVILAALFHSDIFTNLGAKEQTDQLFTLISSIEASCPTAKLDAKGYALAINQMLKNHGNRAAARALLDHMSARGLEPTTQIYTILMTSYFDDDPPDFTAAEALWSRLKTGNSGYGISLDTVFYDRMIEAYAKHHTHVGIKPMMQFLERMSHEGKRPSWPVLELVARALVDRDEWGILHGLIDNIRDSKGLVRVGVRGLVGQNEFWRFIIGTGMLEREGVKHEQEMRKPRGSSSFYGLTGDILGGR